MEIVNDIVATLGDTSTLRWVSQKIYFILNQIVGATLKHGNRNPESKNKAKQSSSNTQKLSCTLLKCTFHCSLCKSKEVNKNGFKAQLLKKGSSVFQFNVRATVIPCEGYEYTNLEYRTA